MSHSVVMVAIKGVSSAAEALEKLHELMEPFDENMEMDPPLEDWIENDEYLERVISFYKEHPEFCPGDGDGPLVPFEKVKTKVEELEWTRQAVGAYNNHRDNGLLKQVDGKHVFGYLTTYNPQSKWDWYAIGGRWHGFFQMKPGVTVGGEELPAYRMVHFNKDRHEGVTTIQQWDGTQQALLGGAGVGGDDPGENFQARADLARKGDIDFDAMRALAGQNAELKYDEFEKVTNGIDPALTFKETLTRFLGDVGLDPEADQSKLTEAERETYNDILQRARNFYHSQPWIKALNEANMMGFFSDPVEDWCVRTGGRETFVKRSIASVTGTFAFLVDGEWNQRGQMHMFGMVSDEMSQGEWLDQQRELLDALDDDTYLAIVDCHI